VPIVRLHPVDDDPADRFAHEAIHGLATLVPSDLTPGNLSLPLGLSLWMRRGRVGTDTACAVLLQLRDALLRVSGLDQRTEPVPLLVNDPGAATVSLAVYLDGLLRRCARHAATTRLDMAERAVADLCA
jgi:hypothetical protein